TGGTSARHGFRAERARGARGGGACGAPSTEEVRRSRADEQAAAGRQPVDRTLDERSGASEENGPKRSEARQRPFFFLASTRGAKRSASCSRDLAMAERGASITTGVPLLTDCGTTMSDGMRASAF